MIFEDRPEGTRMSSHEGTWGGNLQATWTARAGVRGGSSVRSHVAGAERAEAWPRQSRAGSREQVQSPRRLRGPALPCTQGEERPRVLRGGKEHRIKGATVLRTVHGWT